MMKLGKKYLQIATRIAAWITGSATGDDLRDLEAWKREDKHHEILFNELTEQGAFDANRKRLERFSVEEGWDRMKGRLAADVPGRRAALSWMKYAALVAVCIGGGWLYIRVVEKAVPVEITPISQVIPAGKQGARLTLGNGDVVDVFPEKIFTIAEADGTLIQKGIEGIDYTQRKEKKDTLVYNQMQTLTGMEYTLVLADGTRVYLNAESCIRYPVTFQGERREVELQGEAYFKVAKDTRHPFIVKMRDVEVKVVGTSFNVRVYGNEPGIVTTLVEGKVEINGRGIKPGEQAQYLYGTGQLTVKKVDTGLYTAWQEGKFMFRNERLEDIMRTLARWYGVEYHFMDEEVKDIRLGASFGRYEDMSPIIEMMKKTDLVDVLQTNRGIYLSAKK